MSKFDLKDRFDETLYKGFNFLSDVIYFFNKRKLSFVANNEDLKDKHRGERCFILGTGPSLNLISKECVKKLLSEFTFGVNSLYKAEVFRDVYPEYYALVDTKYLTISSDEYGKVLDRYRDKKPIIITDYRAKKILDNLGCSSNSIFIYQKNYPVKYMRCDLSKNSSITMNVVGTCIQAAMHMGFKEIYLLGCDYNAFCNLGYGHCYDDKKELALLKQPNYNLAFYLKFYHLTTEFHYLLKKEADNRGVSIINLTESSLLDAYPKSKLSNVI